MILSYILLIKAISLQQNLLSPNYYNNNFLSRVEIYIYCYKTFLMGMKPQKINTALLSKTMNTPNKM